MLSCSASIERTRPLLGTLVSIRVEDLNAARAHAAIDKAFERVAEIHRLMSFQEHGSDVSRLNREAQRAWVSVQPSTLDVLRRSKKISAASNGAFDVSCAARLVTWGFLAAPENAPAPDERASWRDIEMNNEGQVRFRRPLWIDLSGIAKGYAVDRAIDVLRAAGVEQVCVNAGGDLRVSGTGAERVLLRTDQGGAPMRAIEISDGALASSSGYLHRTVCDSRSCGPHVDGRNGSPAPATRFACVAAGECATADALTKVALALGEGCTPVLRALDASAHIFDQDLGWRQFG
jgi:thiamine biosynthesis lipoprotein